MAHYNGPCGDGPVWTVEFDTVTGKVTNNKHSYRSGNVDRPDPFLYGQNQNTESFVRFRGLRLELHTLVTDLPYEMI